MARLTVATVGTEEASRLLVQEVAAGRLAAVSFAGEVYALVGDGLCPETVPRIEKVKGERPGPPAILVNPLFVRVLFDGVRLPRQLFLHPHLQEELPKIWSNLSFLRFPLRPSAVEHEIPRFLVSTADHGSVLQVFSFFGNKQAWLLEAALYGALARVHPCHLLTPVAITSLNHHGEPPVVTAVEAEVFCRQMGVRLVVHHPREKRGRGSYPIVEVGPFGARLLRQGNQPKKRMLALLPGMVDASGE